jgi:sugar-phosphatase
MSREGDAFPATPGAAALLNRIGGRPWALVTSGSRGPVHKRFKLASLPLPAVQVYGEDVKKSKPAPEGYLKAADLLGIDPSHCIVIEDAPHGITAGKKAGCHVVGVATNHAPAHLARADACFSSLAEATPYLLAAIGAR